MSFVEVSNLTKRYSADFLLHDISFNLEKGEVLTIMGPSGSGKSSLLRNLCGLDSPDSGTIFVEGKDVTSIPVSKRNIGMIFQDLALFPHLSVYDNIAYGLRSRRYDEHEIRLKVNELSNTLRINHLLQRYPAQISGGEQQRVALARSVVYEPSILLLDEPMSSLDMQLRSKVASDTKSFAKQAGLTLIYVTHDHREGFYMADKACVMFDGNLEKPAPPRDLFLNPPTEKTASFFGYNIITRVGDKLAFYPSDVELVESNGDLIGSVITSGFEGEINKVHVKLDGGDVVELWISQKTGLEAVSAGSPISFNLPRTVHLP